MNHPHGRMSAEGQPINLDPMRLNQETVHDAADHSPVN